MTEEKRKRINLIVLAVCIAILARRVVEIKIEYDKITKNAVESTLIDEYEVEFQKIMKSHDIDYEIGDVSFYQNTSKELVYAVCLRFIPFNNKYSNVFINLNLWKTLDDEGRKTVAYHELIHCFLNAGHVDEEREDSIMHPMYDDSRRSYEGKDADQMLHDYMEEFY